MQGTLPSRVRLGEFELDLTTAELRNGDKTVLLTEKPFRVLLALIEHDGELITREDLQKRLWPDDTVVDFEHGINTATSNLRRALRDSAKQPKYIETVGRRGYRLTVPVEQLPVAGGQLPKAAAPPSSPAAGERVGMELRYQSAAEMQADLESLRGSKRSLRLRWRWIAAAAALVIVLTCAWLYWRSRGRTKLTADDTIVRADFTNSTGDPIFDSGLNIGLRVELEQTPFLNVLTPNKVRGALQQINLPENERLTPEVARKVCLHTNSRALVSGSIADAGNQYAIELRAINCETGETLVRTRMEAQDRNQVVKTLGNTGNELRRKLGEPKASLEKFNKPLDIALTPSPEALNAYASGLDRLREKGDREAIPFLQQAVQLDAGFAMAYQQLAGCYWNLFYVARATENARKSYELRDRVTQRQRFVIEQTYYGVGTGELEKAVQAIRDLQQTYPRTATDLAFYLRLLGQFPAAAVAAQGAIRLAPGNYQPYANLSAANLAMNRFDDARSALELAKKRGIDAPRLRLNRYWLACIEGDTAMMDQQLVWARNNESDAYLVLDAEGDSYAYHGQLTKARRSLRNLLAFAEQGKVGAVRQFPSSTAVWWEGLAGNVRRTQQAATGSLSAAANPSVKAQTAISLAVAGRTAQAGIIADQLNGAFPLDTMMQSYSIPTIRAAAVMDEDPARAIALLEPVKPYELGGKYQWHLEPVYVRGLAYLRAGRGQEAAREFQKIIEHPGIVLVSMHGAVARLQLARAEVMMGDKAAARKSYQDFLTLWKDADPDIPICKQAKAEYAKLK